MTSWDRATLVKVFGLVKYPRAQIDPTQEHAAKVKSLFRKCMRLSLYPETPFHARLLSLPWLYVGHKTSYVRELFRRRKIETNPIRIQQFIQEAEQFIIETDHPEPIPLSHYHRGGVLYQRNEPFDEIYLDPSNQVDFEAFNELESESDFYINRYKFQQQQALDKQFDRPRDIEPTSI